MNTEGIKNLIAQLEANLPQKFCNAIMQGKKIVLEFAECGIYGTLYHESVSFALNSSTVVDGVSTSEITKLFDWDITSLSDIIADLEVYSAIAAYPVTTPENGFVVEFPQNIFGRGSIHRLGN